MKEFFQSLKAFWTETVNYLKGMLNRALEILSLRGETPEEAEEPHGGRVTRVEGEFEKPRRGLFRGPYGWRVHFRRLERGRSGTHRPQWRR